MSDESNQVSISIFGQEYSVKAPADPEYIKKIGEYLDGKMREVQAGFTTTQSSTRIAILAAMNITDELFTSRQSSGSVDSEVEEKISTLIELIEETI
ncbi:MAG: cell division protein ZapA [Candidatus Neomarinimicrobiota bacterium]|nr:cell division protein ZapA [Candidatus Neomarinimicrobiota bacterium]